MSSKPLTEPEFFWPGGWNTKSGLFDNFNFLEVQYFMYFVNDIAEEDCF